MRILLSIKAILNYLYNHLIDLVWTKKIRFADGSEMTTVPTGNNLYDIKILSQAIADKGFAFMCHTSRRDLPKSLVPTLYNDIKSKYDSADLENNPTINMYNTNSKNLYIKDGYYYFNNGTRELRRSANSDLSASELCFEVPEEIFYWNWTFIITDIGFWILGTCSGQEHNERRIYIYDFDYNLIQTINITEDDNEGEYIFKKFGEYVYLSVGRQFYRFRDVINTTKQYMPRYLNIEDPNNPYYEITWNINIIDDKIICCSLTSVDGYFRHFFVLNKNTLEKQQLSFHDNDSYWDWNTSPISNIFKFSGNYYLTAHTYDGLSICKINIENGFVSEKYLPKINGVYVSYSADGSLCEVVGDRIIIQTSLNVLISTDLINFEEIYTFNNPYGLAYNKCSNWYLSNDTMIFFFQKDIYKQMYQPDDCYLYIGLIKQVYTDNYIIGRTTVSINYYKFQDFKICISDGGTNDTNLETVYIENGWLPYFVIDLNNETICVQRDFHSFSSMYVGDDFVDDLDDLPLNEYTGLTFFEEMQEYVDTKIAQIQSIKTCITNYALNHLSSKTKDTVYQASEDTLIIIGRTSFTDDFAWSLQVSRDNNNWTSVLGHSISSGDPGNSVLQCVVIEKGLYYKATGSGIQVYNSAPLRA